MFSEDGRYRYRLERRWDDGLAVTFVLLNPNQADATTDDPTIRRCVGFAKRWGHGRLTVVNLFAWRARHPSELRNVSDPVGTDNESHLRDAIAGASCVVAAWGNHGALLDRDRVVRPWLGPVWCLGVNRTGQPRHPLYVRGDASLLAF